MPLSRVAACLAIVLLLVQPGVSAPAHPAAGSTDDDAYPVWPTDGCSYWENRGVLLFFQPDSAVPLGQERAEALLDHIAIGWREDRGFILIEGHLGVSEAASQAPTADLQRVEVVRDGLVARGIPAALIWLKPLGAAEPLVPGAMAEEDDRQNRRAVVLNTRRGEACLAQRRHLRVTWFRRHCMPDPRPASNIAAVDCARALDELEWGK